MTRDANTYDKVKAAAAISQIAQGLEAFLCEPLDGDRPALEHTAPAPALLVK